MEDKNTTPPVVRRKDAKEALEYLVRAGFPVLEFLEETNADHLLSQSLGPTPECLSVEGIAELVGETLGANRREKANLTDAHVQKCADCKSNIALYRRLVRRSRRVAGLEHAEVAAVESEPEVRLQISPANLEVSGPNEDLVLIIDATGEWSEGGIVRIDPDSVSLRSQLLKARGCVIERLREPMDFTTSVVYAARFRVDCGGFLEQAAVRPDVHVLDWIDVEGRTVSGFPFRERFPAFIHGPKEASVSRLERRGLVVP